MKCSVKTAQAALRVAKSAADAKSANKSFGAVKVTCVDGVATMEAKNGVLGVRRPFVVSDAGELLSLVEIVKLEKTLSVMKGDVTLSQGEGTGLIVTAGARTVTIPGEELADFAYPVDAPTDGETILHADGSALADIIGRVSVYASNDQTRPVLTGIAVDVSGNLVGCDSYHLGVFECAGIDSGAVERLAHDDRTVNIAVQAWTLAAKGMKGADVSVSVAGKWAVIATGDAVWTARIIAGTYPHWSQLIPDDFEVTATLTDGAELHESADAARKLLSRNNPMRMGLNGGLTVKAVETRGVNMTESVPASITYAKGAAWEEGAEIGLSPEYVMNALRSLEGGEVKVNFITPLRPVLFTGAAGQALVMPVRIDA